MEIPKFYVPVTNLLMERAGAPWKGMKTVGMLRKEKGLKYHSSKDSKYQKVSMKSHHLKRLDLFVDSEAYHEQMGPIPSSNGSLDITLSNAHT